MPHATLRLRPAVASGRGMPFAPLHAVTPRSHRALALVLLAAGCGPADGRVRLVGTVERTLVEIVAPVSEVVTEIPVERGARVAPEQVLARLDPTLANVEVARAEAALAGARTAAGVADIDLERTLELRRGRVASPRDVDQARLAHDEAEARLREARPCSRRRTSTRATSCSPRPSPAPWTSSPSSAASACRRVRCSPWCSPTRRRGCASSCPRPPSRRSMPGPAPASASTASRLALDGRVLDVAREPEFTPHYALTERDRVYLVYETRVRIENAPAELRPGVPAEVELLPEETAAGASP